MAIETTVILPAKNIWAEKELIKQFRHEHTWLSEIVAKNKWVNNDVIKIPKRGAVPNVLINNAIYPIVSNKRDDAHVVVSLNKYETTNTVVSDDELYALPYEKINDVQMQHREELEDKTAEHGLHSIAPAGHSAETPVLKTTGADDGTGRKRLTTTDLVRLKTALDKNKAPKSGRILVLCSDHVGDLLDEDRKFFAQYQNIKNGVISANYCGFKTYEANYTPSYANDLKKEAFGSVTTGYPASVAFHKRSTLKARGTVKRYASSAALNPTMRENVLGFRLWFIAVAFRSEGIAAMVSAAK